MKKINSYWYSKGKFDRKTWRPIDEKNEYLYSIRYFDVSISGWDSINVLLAIEKNSNIDTTKVRNKIKEKFEWWKENEQEDYKRCFGDRKIDDIFVYYEEKLKEGEK